MQALAAGWSPHHLPVVPETLTVQAYERFAKRAVGPDAADDDMAGKPLMSSLRECVCGFVKIKTHRERGD